MHLMRARLSLSFLRSRTSLPTFEAKHVTFCVGDSPSASLFHVKNTLFLCSCQWKIYGSLNLNELSVQGEYSGLTYDIYNSYLGTSLP